MERKNYKSTIDKYEIVYDKFLAKEGKDKTFVIIHGKNEYSDRYHNFAKFLQKNGYSSYIINHRGHGHTGVLNDDMGYFQGNVKDIFLSDIDGIVKIARKENPENKIILLGHSMGSYITRYYISERKFIDAYVCIGTTYQSKILVKTMKSLAFVISRFKGKRECPILNRVLSSNTDRKFSKDDPGAWLTHDKKIANDFLASPLSKSKFKSKTVYDLAWLLNKTSSMKTIKKIDHKMPILLLSGEEDITSGNGELVKKLYDIYKKQNLNVEMKIYKKMRHEILQEKDKEKVYKDIIKFVEKVK